MKIYKLLHGELKFLIEIYSQKYIYCIIVSLNFLRVYFFSCVPFHKKLMSLNVISWETSNRFFFASYFNSLRDILKYLLKFLLEINLCWLNISCCAFFFYLNLQFLKRFFLAFEFLPFFYNNQKIIYLSLKILCHFFNPCYFFFLLIYFVEN